MFEMPAFTNRFAVRGTHFARENIALVVAGDDVCLDPEPDNPHDPRAIRVCVLRGNTLLHVGYVPRENCEQLHGLLSQSAVWNTKIHSVTNDDSGLMVLVSFESTGLLGRQASVS